MGERETKGSDQSLSRHRINILPVQEAAWGARRLFRAAVMRINSHTLGYSREGVRATFQLREKSSAIGQRVSSAGNKSIGAEATHRSA